MLRCAGLRVSYLNHSPSASILGAVMPCRATPLARCCALATAALLLALTPAFGQSRSLSASGVDAERVVDFLSQVSADPPLEIAQQFIATGLATTRLAAPRSWEYRLESQYVSTSSGVSHFWFRQKVDGIPVWNGDYSVHVNRNGRVIDAHDRFGPALQTAAPGLPQLSPQAALAAAAEALGLELSEALQVLELLELRDEREPQLVLSRGGISLDPIPVSLMFLSCSCPLSPTFPAFLNALPRGAVRVR
jgi:hypothetical protein